MDTIGLPTVAPPRLFLRDLEISGFRAFDALTVPHLGRVNVFVGPNSAGKSSLLEAMRLLAHAGSPGTIVDILISRDELSRRTLGLSEEDVELLNPTILQLFHGLDAESSAQSIRIGASGTGPAISIERGWIVRAAPEPVQRFVTVLENEDLAGGPRRALQIGGADGLYRPVPFQRLASFVREVPWDPLVPCVHVGAHGLATVEAAELWDRIALTEMEDSVLDALRILAPIDRLSLIGDFDGKGERKAVVRVPGSKRPLPLRSLGDGVHRLFGLALALVNARGGVLLVDEVENGLHFSVQDDVWRAVFELAARYDVQVFATTHSWDTIVGFQYAANISEEEGVLYRLDPRQGGITAVAYTEREVEIAAEQRIEVR